MGDLGPWEDLQHRCAELRSYPFERSYREFVLVRLMPWPGRTKHVISLACCVPFLSHLCPSILSLH